MDGLVPPITDVMPTDDGERIFFAEWPGPSEPTLVAVHGLTNQHRNLAGVAAALGGDLRVVAPDLRGRGASSKPGPGSYGIARHAADVLALMERTGVERAIVAGHSMGAYVALAVAARAPEHVAGVVLVDGGVWMDAPEGASGNDRLLAQVEVVVRRLSETFPTPEAYLTHWRSYPAYANGLDEVIVSNLMYDIGRHADGYIPKCSPVAAEEDLKDATRTGPALDDHLRRIRCPVLAIGAEHGILMAPERVLGDRHLTKLRSLVTEVESVMVPGTDHHTVTLSVAGARASAEAIRRFAASLPRGDASGR